MDGTIVYSYHPETGVFEGTVFSPPNPEEPGRFIIHANSTELAPPTVKKNEAAVFDKAAKEWVIKCDYTGKVYYDTATQEKQIIKEIGVEPNPAWTEFEPADSAQIWNGTAWELPFEVLKKQKIAEIAAMRWEQETGGLKLNDFVIATDRESRSQINAAVMSTVLDPDYTVRWKMINGFYDLDASAIQMVATAVRNHVQACFDREAELYAAVDAAETPEAVNNINWR